MPPATTVPKFVVAAATLLFDQGLADPRGGEYRTIEVMSGIVWSGHGLVGKSRGWVLPVADPNTLRFAVGWDGLVHPLVRVGAPADLDADLAQLVRLSRPGQGLGLARANGRANPDPAEPERLVGPTELTPIEVCLLLRLGRVDLAGSVWAALNQQTTNPLAPVPGLKKPSLDLRKYRFSYLTIAQDLAWSHFERASFAIKWGGDAVVLHDARFLTRFNAAVEREAQALGFPRPRSFNQSLTKLPYIDFLGQLPIILADAERRALEPPRPPTPPRDGPDPTARIAALIQDLDQIVVTQNSQPGGVSLGAAATVQALIAEGDPAVEPLIAALRHDQRLTRSVSFWRDFARSRTFLTTFDAAYAALAGILHTTNFSAGSTGDNLSARGPADRQQVADRIEAYWRQYKAFPLVERWYQTLANDKAAPGAWIEAAGNITQPDNVRIVPGSTAFTQTVTTSPRPGETPGLAGESLRVGHTPSVTQLMIRRVESLGKPNQVDLAITMTGRLQGWDPAAALPTLQKVSGLIRDQITAAPKINNKSQIANRITSLASFALERAKLGDFAALGEYAASIRTTDPETFEHDLLPPLQPFYRLPADLTLLAAGDHLFNDPGSPWANLFRPGRRFSFQTNLKLVDSALVRVPGFRRALHAALDDQTEVGAVEVKPDGQISIKFNDGGQSGTGSQRVDPLVPPPGSTVPVRVADQVAQELSQLAGAPEFQAYWPVVNRAAAIQGLHAYLDHYGPRFVADKPPADRSFDHRKTAYLVFPALDHPATPAEVADGRAIFSLEGPDIPPGHRRVVPMFDHPLTAQWTTLHDFPIKVRSQGVNDEERLEYANWGEVWQAEEVLEAGVWKRYYGFVGGHRIAQVPAAAIEFGDRYGWFDRQSPNGWGLLFELTTPAATKRILGPGLVIGGATPVTATIQLKNRLGVDQSLPTELVRTREGRTVGLVTTLQLKLEVADPLPPNQANRLDAAILRRWTVIPLKPEVTRFDPGDPMQTIRPAEKSPLIPLNLTELFGISQPKRYRLSVQYGPTPPPVADGVAVPPVVFDFNLIDPAIVPRSGATVDSPDSF